MPKKSFTSALLLTTIIAVLFIEFATAKCYTGVPYFNIPPKERQLADCDWYNSNTCCSVETSQRISDEWNRRSGSGSNATIPEWAFTKLFSGCLSEVSGWSEPCLHCPNE